MRTVLLFDDIDATINQTSIEINIDQRVEWQVTMTTSGTDGTPKIFIEQAFTGGGCLPPPTDWYIIPNKCLTTGDFLIDDSPYIIEKDSLKGNWIRLRLEPNDNTTGTLRALLGYKTFT